MKYTTTEKRAKNFCEKIKESNHTLTIVVRWVKSRVWGYCPRIENNNREKLTNISGCGYDKLSACLASALCWLGNNEDEIHRILCCSGAGENKVVETLDKCGWILEKLHTDEALDIYSISHKEE